MPAPSQMPPMRIGIIASVRHGLREPHAGGLERHTATLATDLRRLGHDVVVYASGTSDPDLGVVPICPEDSLLDFSPAARGDVSMLSDRFMVEHHAYLGCMLALADGGVDVVHDNSLHYLPVAMAASIPSPVVKVLHTPPTPWLESALHHRAATTTVVSVSRANARSWQTPIDRVIPNGIDLTAFAPGDGVGRTAIWSGRLVPEKGPRDALLAARAAGVDLALAGPAPDPSYFDEAIAPLLDDRRTWLGHLDAAALAEEIGRSAVALVTPRWDEPFGLVVLEALACGTPVAGYARGALPEILTPDVGLLVARDDVDALAVALHRAAELDRTACRTHAEAIGSGERMARDYLDCYARAVAA